MRRRVDLGPTERVSSRNSRARGRNEPPRRIPGSGEFSTRSHRQRGPGLNLCRRLCQVQDGPSRQLRRRGAKKGSEHRAPRGARRSSTSASGSRRGGLTLWSGGLVAEHRRGRTLRHNALSNFVTTRLRRWLRPQRVSRVASTPRVGTRERVWLECCRTLTADPWTETDVSTQAPLHDQAIVECRCSFATGWWTILGLLAGSSRSGYVGRRWRTPVLFGCAAGW